MAQAKGKIIIWVMLITILSKCFGFGRDMILAYFFGASNITDAYFIAQTIPEFLFSIVVQTIAVGFIPVYIDIMHKQSSQKAAQFSTQVLFGSWILCVGLVIFVNFFTSQIVSIFASNFSAQAAQTAILFVKITVLAMFFRITTNVVSASLQANNNFIFPAAIGLPFDIVVIISVIIAAFTSPVILAWGLVVAAAIQVVFLLPQFLKNLSFDFSQLFPLFTPSVKKMCALFLPVALGVSANQINILVDRTLASGVQGGISALNYANKTNNVVENIIILSLAMVMFPTFAAYVSKKDFKSFITSVAKSINIVIFTMLPCSAFFIIFAPDIIKVLFGHGVFDASSVAQTSSVMRFYAIGLLGISVSIIFTRALYAVQKVKWVSITACFSVALNVILNLILSRMMGIKGLALATSIASSFSACVLFILLTHYLKTSFLHLFNKELLKCLLATTALVVITIQMQRLFAVVLPEVIACVVSGVIAGSIYIGICILLKCDSLKYSYSIINEIKRKFISIKNDII